MHQFLNGFSLNAVSFEDDKRRNPLDHAFTRGLIVRTAKVLNEINSSDHLPLYLELDIKID